MRPLSMSRRFVVCMSVPLSFSVLHTTMSPAKTEEPIEMPFWWWWTHMSPMNHIIDVCTLAPHGSICLASAMRSVATITVATCDVDGVCRAEAIYGVR